MNDGAPDLLRVAGRVHAIAPSHIVIEGLSPVARLGDCVEIAGDNGFMSAEIVHVGRDRVTAKPYGADTGILIGASAWHKGRLSVAPHPGWCGRVVNAVGQPIDGAGTLPGGTPVEPLQTAPPPPMHRNPTDHPVVTGIRAIDLFTPLCAGQRIGIFAAAGVGKSRLLTMLAGAGSFDRTVIALVGERGREVRDFIDHAKASSEGRVTAVVATADESAMMRRLAPATAMAIAESCRDAGQSVLLIVDSITRYAQAARDVALSAGEVPVARGYPPEVFTCLQRLMERAGPGTGQAGSITGVFSVLVDGDDPNEPVADCIRGTLDGHIVLSREIAAQSRYPAIDVMSSVSRLADSVWTARQKRAVFDLRSLVARFEDSRDLRAIGAHRKGAEPETDRAMEVVPMLYDYLRQDEPDRSTGYDPFGRIARHLAPSAADQAA